jgi:hypothetical protein
MSRNTFFHNAHSRLPFAGVSEFYKSLQLGRNGKRNNPFFYVSSSPWNLYDLLIDFLDLNDIPLASREGAARRQTLQHAATLDPDVGVRSAARLVLEGVRIGVDAVGNGAAWLSVEAAGGARPAASAAVLTAAGLALPVIADPDGAIVLLGLPAGPIDLRVATDAKAGKAPSSSGGKKTHQR